LVLLFFDELTKAVQNKADRRELYQFVTAKQKYSFFEFSDLVKHRAVILFPYAVLSYGITELYALEIPMFVPSVKFILDLGILDDLFLTSGYYCGNLRFEDIPKSHPDNNNTFPFSPEDHSRAAREYWTSFADIYQWKHIQHFDSFDHLISLLDQSDFQEISEKMHQANIIREKELTENWKKVFSKIDRSFSPRTFPRDYNLAIRNLWNESQWMVE
jgi:hypothetical protein